MNQLSDLYSSKSFRNKKIDDPDWERLRQICISANNQYKYLENQKKQNATKK